MKESIQSPVCMTLLLLMACNILSEELKNNQLAAKIKEALQPMVLYIADGHHRAASAVRVGFGAQKKWIFRK